MARALDAYGAKVHRQHIEGRLGTALYRRRHQCREAVHALALHGLDQHRSRRTAGKRFDQRSRQGIDEACVPAQRLHHPANAFQTEIQRAGGAQSADRAKHGDQVGQQAFGDIEAFLRALDERLVHRNLAQRADDQEGDDQAEQGQVAQQRRQRRQRGRREPGQQRHEATEQQCTGNEVGQHHRIPQAQPLHQCHRQQAGQRRRTGRQEDRQKDQGRVFRSLLYAVHEDRHRQ